MSELVKDAFEQSMVLVNHYHTLSDSKPEKGVSKEEYTEQLEHARKTAEGTAEMFLRVLDREILSPMRNGINLANRGLRVGDTAASPENVHMSKKGILVDMELEITNDELTSKKKIQEALVEAVNIGSLNPVPFSVDNIGNKQKIDDSETNLVPVTILLDPSQYSRGQQGDTSDASDNVAVEPNAIYASAAVGQQKSSGKDNKSKDTSGKSDEVSKSKASDSNKNK